MIQRLIDQLERVANDPRYTEDVRKAARRDANGYRDALAKVAKS